MFLSILHTGGYKITLLCIIANFYKTKRLKHSALASLFKDILTVTTFLLLMIVKDYKDLSCPVDKQSVLNLLPFLMMPL